MTLATPQELQSVHRKTYSRIQFPTEMKECRVADNEARSHAGDSRQGDCQNAASSIATRLAGRGSAARTTYYLGNECSSY
jgi:hypothetical protein